MGVATGRRVIVVEPFSSGHRAVWASAAARALAGAGYPVVVCTLPGSLVHPEFKALQSAGGEIRVISRSSDHSNVEGRTSLGGAYLAEWRAWRLLRDLYEAAYPTKSDVVVVPYLDYCLHLVAMRGSPFYGRSWIGMTMRPTFHFSSMGIVAPRAKFARMRAALFMRMLRDRSLLRCLTPDTSLVEFVNRRHPDVASSIGPVSDPVPLLDMLHSQEEGSVPSVMNGRTSILVYGTINGRKGLSLLLEAAASPECSREIVIVVAGRQQEDARKMLANSAAQALRMQGRLVEIEGWIDSATESRLFKEASAIWVAYQGHYQVSGVLAQAYFWRLPVIAAAEGVVGWDVSRHHTGVVFQPGNRMDAVQALNSLCDMEKREEYRSRIVVRQQTSTEGFGAALLRALRHPSH